MVEPVGSGDYLVLVAQLEPLDGVTERDVSRFVVEDLTAKLDTSVPFSNIRIREYPQVITTDKDARAAAEANRAAVIVWGNYTPESIELKIQIGSTAPYKYLRFDRTVLERTGNFRARLIDERRESVALPVLFALDMLQMADGNSFEASRLNAIAAEMLARTFVSAEILDTGISVHLNRFVMAYLLDPPQAMTEMDAAIGLDSGNPLLYVFRCAVRLRADLIDKGIKDCETAQRLGPDGWAIPMVLLSTPNYWTGDFDTALTYWDQIVAARPDDWYSYNFRGSIHYLNHDYDLARVDYDHAMELGPEANFPYIFATMVALHQGRVSDAQTYARTMLVRFPNPDFSNRVVEASLGSDLFGSSIAAGGYLLIGQYEQALQTAEAALTFNDQLSDMYLVEGFAYCNLEDYDAAETAYSRAIDLEPDFAALYLLRAEVELKQGDLLGSGKDMLTAQTYHLGPEFAALIQAAATGTLSCQNFFEYDLSGTAVQPTSAVE
jgi:tetratricopeptide (TPR) repeat protein